VTSQGLQIESMTGSDDEVAQAGNQSSPDPKPVEMPFQIVTSGNYASTRNTIEAFGRSIRPFQIKNLQIEVGQDAMSMTLEAKTFYQPAKNFNLTKKVVK
jgi:hypothetical protein